MKVDQTIVVYVIAFERPTINFYVRKLAFCVYSFGINSWKPVYLRQRIFYYTINIGGSTFNSRDLSYSYGNGLSMDTPLAEFVVRYNLSFWVFLLMTTNDKLQKFYFS